MGSLNLFYCYSQVRGEMFGEGKCLHLGSLTSKSYKVQSCRIVLSASKRYQHDLLTGVAEGVTKHSRSAGSPQFRRTIHASVADAFELARSVFELHI